MSFAFMALRRGRGERVGELEMDGFCCGEGLGFQADSGVQLPVGNSICHAR